MPWKSATVPAASSNVSSRVLRLTKWPCSVAANVTAAIVAVTTASTFIHKDPLPSNGVYTNRKGITTRNALNFIAW
jgi:hypothetical protein